MHGLWGVPEPAARQPGEVLAASLTCGVCETKNNATTQTSKRTTEKSTMIHYLRVAREKKKKFCCCQIKHV